MQEDRKLKRFLVLQSFCPLFVLVFIRHADIMVFLNCFDSLIHGRWSVIMQLWKNNTLWNLVITVICIIWFLMTVFVAMGFRNIHDSGFDHNGEMIIIVQEKKDSGITFLIGFILPLLVDDISSFRGFIFFIVLLMMVIFLLMRSDLFYQNPVLVALHYRTYEFKFVNPDEGIDKNNTYIGISKGGIPFDDVAIKRRYIADDVFLIENG